MFKILIVEDDTELCQLFSHVLEKNGYEAVYDAMWWYKLKFGTGVQGVFWNPRWRKSMSTSLFRTS